MLGVFIRMAQLESRAGSRDPVMKSAIVMQAVTSLEQFLRLVLEGRLDEERGAARRSVGVRGLEGEVGVSASRIDASMRGFQNVGAIKRLAREHGPPALRECLRSMGPDLDWALDLRHDLAHSLGVVRFDAARPLRIVRSAMECVMEGSPRDMAASLLVKAAVMDADGRTGAAREAAEEALAVCDAHVDRTGGRGKDSWALVCRGHALARLRRTAEAEAAYGALGT